MPKEGGEPSFGILRYANSICGLVVVANFQEHRQRKKERVQKRIADAFQQSLLSTDQSRVDVSKLLSSLSLEDEAARPRGSKFTRAEKLQFTKVGVIAAFAFKAWDCIPC